MSSAADFEQQLTDLLQNPEQMQSIFSLARSLGLSPPQGPTEPAPVPKPPEPTASAVNDTLSELLQKAGKLDRRQENLLNALKPFLKPARREKIDRAMQAARLSRLAGAALRGREQSEPEKR